MKAVIDESAFRVTAQFRAGEAMVYDLRSAGRRLTLRVTGRGGAEDGPPTEWRIAASMSTSPEAVVVAECAATRADALEAVGKTWGLKRMACDLPAFDWESVALALRGVRAI